MTTPAIRRLGVLPLLLMTAGWAGSLLLCGCPERDDIPPPPPPPFWYGEDDDGDDDTSGPQTCSTCHGSEDNSAPPVTTEGLSATSEIGVGAHQSHLRDGEFRQAIACDECHVVPVDPENPACVDGLPAEMVWGELAALDIAEPEWDRDSATCDDTYCHGSTLGGGTNLTPTWTVVDGSEVYCGSCHAGPPPVPHPGRADCSSCHDETVDDGGLIVVAGGRHIDGVVDHIALECNTCHGNADNDAPPISTFGTSSTAEIEVGAHQTHLHDGDLRRAVSCNECHVVPGKWAPHTECGDGPPAEVEWGALATTNGAVPDWDRTIVTCSGAYCHGATLSGGMLTEPEWTTVDGTQSMCGTCHGVPPVDPHPQDNNCHECHPDTIDPSYDINIDKHIDGVLDVSGYSCNGCHGNQDNAAPPVDLLGSTDTADVTVGAHQSHLFDGTLSVAVACDECHLVPTGIGDPGHIDASPAETTWGPLATADGANPSWDRTLETCSEAYCHGATLSSGSNTEPQWTLVDGSQKMCGACHGVPPASPHVNSTDCYTCHGTTIDEFFNLDINHHIDGILDVSGQSCNSCHGGPNSPAPPVSLAGSSDPADVEVGAHESHLNDGNLRRAVDCEECHIVPGSVSDPDHLGPAPAELMFGTLAVTDGANPVWDHGVETCTDAYCHGATLGGGNNTEPMWTIVDGSQSMCGTCHGAPPPAPHPQMGNCHDCHSATIDAFFNLDLDRHIDGQLDVDTLDCSSCHGSPANAAPPVDTSGSSDEADVTVGAHQSHITDGDLRLAVDCEECHVVPQTMAEPTHMDAPPAELTWGPLALADSVSPVWDRTLETCSDAYCHGPTLAGGSNVEPLWTIVDGSQSACGTCHGDPPPSPHPGLSSCTTCHPDTVDALGDIDVAGGMHINGTLEVSGQDCSACHGSPTNPAPPVSVGGSSDVGDVEVGAHQTHLTDGLIRAALDCEECHVVPGDIADPTHIDVAPAEVLWGSLALADNVNPVWDRTAETCTDAYCHGPTISGGYQTVPVWTVVNGSQAACGTCHSIPPAPPHPAMADCSLCHAGTVDAFGAIDIASGQHIDGVVQAAVTGSCDLCHEAPPASGAHLVHFGATAADASYGGTGVTLDLLPAGNAYAFDCGNCHPMDTAQHLNGVANPGGGHAEVELSPVGAPPGSVRSLHAPTASYTPGGSIFTDAQGFDYTLGTCSDIYCHSALQHETVGPVPEPGLDFPFSGYPITYPAYGTTTTRIYTSPTWADSLACVDCHGFIPRTDDPTVEAGAVDSHSWIDAGGYESLHGWNHGGDPVACATCHHDTVTDQGVRYRTSVPPANQWSVYDPVTIFDHSYHVDGLPDVAFTTDLVPVLATTFDLSAASYDPTSRTCSDVECHLGQTTVEWGTPFRWGNTYECNVCHDM